MPKTEKLEGTRKSFYVLEYADNPGWYTCDDQYMMTESIEGATKYDDIKFAKRIVKANKGHMALIIKKVTVLYIVEPVDEK